VPVPDKQHSFGEDLVAQLAPWYWHRQPFQPRKQTPFHCPCWQNSHNSIQLWIKETQKNF